MDLISHLAGNKNIVWKFDVVEKLKRNNKRLTQSGYQFQFKFQLMMISMNLHNVFFILMCSYALFSTFRGSFRADCIEQLTTFERQFFRCLLAGLCNVPAKSDREDVGNGAYTLRPHPGQEFQTICRCHSLAGSTFSSDILRL